MAIPNALIEIPKGADKAVPLVLTNPDGSVADISTATEILLVVKATAETASAAIISLSLTGGTITLDTDGTDGLATAQFVEADTDARVEDLAEWVFDVWGDLPVGGKDQWIRVGRFRMLPRSGNP